MAPAPAPAAMRGLALDNVARWAWAPEDLPQSEALRCPQPGQQHGAAWQRGGSKWRRQCVSCLLVAGAAGSGSARTLPGGMCTLCRQLPAPPAALLPCLQPAKCGPPTHSCWCPRPALQTRRRWRRRSSMPGWMPSCATRLSWTGCAATLSSCCRTTDAARRLAAALWRNRLLWRSTVVRSAAAPSHGHYPPSSPAMWHQPWRQAWCTAVPTGSGGSQQPPQLLAPPANLHIDPFEREWRDLRPSPGLERNPGPLCDHPAPSFEPAHAPLVTPPHPLARAALTDCGDPDPHPAPFVPSQSGPHPPSNLPFLSICF